MALSSYHAPLAASQSSLLLGWMREGVQEARNCHAKQPGWDQLDSDYELISRHQPLYDNNSTLPWLNVGNTKARIGDVVSTLSNLRPLWQVQTGVNELQEPTKILNKCSLAWWQKTRADLKVREALQWSAVCRTGYLWVRWNPHFRGQLNLGDIDLVPLGPKSVFFLWMPEGGDHQMAYVTFIAETVPIVQACADYPLFAAQLKPSVDDVGITRRFIAAVKSAAAMGADRLFQGDPPKVDTGQTMPHVTIYHAYIRDLTMNHTGRQVTMGDPSSKWTYDVPFIGKEIPTGFVNPSTAQDVTRRANDSDCYLYPNRRLVSFTDTAILYDGPSREYHGLAPIAKFTLDPWPWDFLGGSMVQDVKSIDAVINQTLRGMQKAEELRRNPPKMVSDGIETGTPNSEQPEIAKVVNTDIGEPGATIKVDFTKGDPIRPILTPESYDQPPWIFEKLKFLDAKADFVLGRAQMEALAVARQMPAGDTQEKWLQAIGARTTAKSRSIEAAMCDLGQMVVCNILQWYNSRRRFTLFGWEGIAKQDFDFDPDSLIPDGFTIDSGGFHTDGRSTLYKGRYQRARAMVKMISLDIEPMSIHEITSMTRQLEYLRLYEGMHFPMDSWTLAKALNIPNMGSPPPTTNDTLPERYMAESDIRSEAMAMMQAKAQMIAAQANPQAVIEQAIKENPQAVLQMVLQSMQSKGNSNGSEGGGSNGATGRPEGRPPEFSAPPKLFNRTDENGGERTVLATSKTT